MSWARRRQEGWELSVLSLILLGGLKYPHRAKGIAWMKVYATDCPDKRPVCPVDSLYISTEYVPLQGDS
jgi:hypothetical protein